MPELVKRNCDFWKNCNQKKIDLVEKYNGKLKAFEFTIPTIKKAYESLLQARIAKKIKALSNIGIPLEVYTSDKKFKNLFLDIGLMNRVMGID